LLNAPQQTTSFKTFKERLNAIKENSSADLEIDNIESKPIQGFSK
jgi:hypothetical protein